MCFYVCFLRFIYYIDNLILLYSDLFFCMFILFFYADSSFSRLEASFMIGRMVVFPSFHDHIKRLKGKKIKPPQRGFTIILFSSIRLPENFHK